MQILDGQKKVMVHYGLSKLKKQDHVTYNHIGENYTFILTL